MQSEPGRYINSVSDLLYSTDEIEFLLDDIRDLEPTSCKPEDIQSTADFYVNVIGLQEPDGMSCVLQDFEIAGSRTGALSADCAGGCECESPLGTVNSWDSHSHYRRRVASPDLSLYSGVIVYCDHTHLKTPTGIVRILLLVTTIACLTCLCTSGTVKVGLFMLPLVGRLRLMMFVTLLSIFITCLLLFLDISHVVYLFPFNWGKVNAYLYVSLSVLFLVASSLIFHTIFLSEAFYWVPRWTHHQLLITGCLGYLCCFQSAILSLIQKCSMGHYQPVAEDPSLNLQERQTSLQDSPEHKANQTTHNYKPIASYPVASTSRQDASNYLDDVQPCSSKSSDPYRVA
ncbi:uncharacterized protein LOC657427 isoform X1 [Tribolium castaneum]|uniref:uncharacterized protein LOC657427 isoform X1 n=1 Tax=Tribolium castaneum TaxID=7070 RepID=UPI00077DC48F|nr:PREDICTED: uncharacterized protein LOC657427 isoform X1 [Tribolium castaneum]|eukprot:XP_015837446.1 PREDICTED: uncharacterized protein LOC657427 isoform X1 [Tribolium castaneum]